MHPYYGYGADLSNGKKDALMYAGAGVVGALIARNFVRGAVGLLLGASGGLMVAALVIAHPRSAT